MEVAEKSQDPVALANTDDHVDIVWRPDEDKENIVFSWIVQTLCFKGYCVIQLPNSDTVGQDVTKLKKGRIFTRLHSQTGEAYLGCGTSRSMVSRIDQRLDSEDPLSDCVEKVSAIGEHLGFASEQHFGFTAAKITQGYFADGVVLREESPNDQASSSSLLKYEETEQDDADAEDTISFIRRRKICFMYFIQGCVGGQIKLQPWEDHPSSHPVSLPVSNNRMLLFRHDLFNYAYEPAGIDLVLQAWVLQEPLVWPGGALVGDEEDIKAVLRARGAPMPTIKHVQVKALSCKIGARGNGAAATEMVYMYLTDVFVKIPQLRWDHDLYWTPDRDDGRGLSGVRHSGLCAEDDIWSFDPVRFNMEEGLVKQMTASNFMNLECAYETLNEAGYTMRTLKGANIDIAMGVAGRDAEFEHRIAKNLLDMTTSHYIESQLVKYYLGTVGKAYIMDTACSASNVAFQHVFQDIRRSLAAKAYGVANARDEDLEGLVLGASFVNDHRAFIGLSQAHMLGNTGRSKTFDNSADGYARGEGVGGAYLRRADDTLDNYGFVLGGITNQDGRSASLTAPNGPSQTAVVRGSLRDAGRHYLDVNVSELHGTGTAIGDPIETGSLKAVMAPDRTTPLFHQAGKSMTGHLEFGAGITGIIKTLLAGTHATVTGNCHLKFLNANVDNNAYNAIWPTEMVDLNREFNHNGMSSFGFGGSNARCDLWGRCKRGHHTTAPVGPTALGFMALVDRRHKINTDAVDVFLAACASCSRSMCWMCGELTDTIAAGKHKCKVVRKLQSGYDTCTLCYSGPYLIESPCSGDAGDPGQPVYIVGSWSCFSKYEEMRRTDVGYEIQVDLQNLKHAEFRLVLNKNSDLSLYPSKHRSTQSDRHHIVGPDSSSEGRNWLIDVGYSETGSMWKIEFTWDYGGRKSISWQIVESSRMLSLQELKGLERSPTKYTLVGTIGHYGNWQSQELLRSDAEDGLWEAKFAINDRGAMEFQFMVDNDSSQIIHPDGCQVVDVSIPIVGPSPASSDKTWYILGLVGEEVKLQLRNNANGMSLTLFSKTAGKRTWYSRSEAKWNEHQYFLTGSFNGWMLDAPMPRDALRPLCYGQEIKIGPSKSEYLRIVVDKDPRRLLPDCVVHSHGLAHSTELKDGSILYGCHGPVGAKVRVMLEMRGDISELMFMFMGWDEALATEETEQEELNEPLPDKDKDRPLTNIEQFKMMTQIVGSIDQEELPDGEANQADDPDHGMN